MTGAMAIHHWQQKVVALQTWHIDERSKMMKTALRVNMLPKEYQDLIYTNERWKEGYGEDDMSKYAKQRD